MTAKKKIIIEAEQVEAIEVRGPDMLVVGGYFFRPAEPSNVYYRITSIADESRWIAATDRLPAECIPVLAWIVDAEIGGYFAIAAYNTHRKYWQTPCDKTPCDNPSDGDRECEVSHWQPIPSAPDFELVAESES
jgi:hypothetical protein